MTGASVLCSLGKQLPYLPDIDSFLFHAPSSAGVGPEEREFLTLLQVIHDEREHPR